MSNSRGPHRVLEQFGQGRPPLLDELDGLIGLAGQVESAEADPDDPLVDEDAAGSSFRRGTVEEVVDPGRDGRKGSVQLGRPLREDKVLPLEMERRGFRHFWKDRLGRFTLWEMGKGPTGKAVRRALKRTVPNLMTWSVVVAVHIRLASVMGADVGGMRRRLW